MNITRRHQKDRPSHRLSSLVVAVFERTEFFDMFLLLLEMLEKALHEEPDRAHNHVQVEKEMMELGWRSQAAVLAELC